MNKELIVFLSSDNQFLIHVVNYMMFESSVQIQICLQFYRWHEERGKKNRSSRNSGFTRFCRKEWKKVLPNFNNDVIENSGRTPAHTAICDRWKELSQRKREKYVFTFFVFVFKMQSSEIYVILKMANS